MTELNTQGNPSKITVILDKLIFLIGLIVILSLGNYPALNPILHNNKAFIILIILFVLSSIKPSLNHGIYYTFRLRVCSDGCRLLWLFLLTTFLTVIFTFIGWLGIYPSHKGLFSDYNFWIKNLLYSIIIETIVFWNGIIRIYLTSKQLSLKLRIFGILLGLIPIIHLILLGMILQTAQSEIFFEHNKMITNYSRKTQKICKTKYPLLLVHGVFFRDIRYFNYWGRIPNELEDNGATIFYGNQQSAASVASCGAELAERIKQIVKETGCEKVNIIAHSKGGLDSRYAISKCGMAPYVASLTTINTPHRGCEFADYLLHKIPKKQQDSIAHAYNTTLRKFGDYNPNFMEAVTDLTAEASRKRNETVKDVSSVYYQSVGSKLNHFYGGKFPLNFSYHLVNRFDGANDGLVGESSFAWGEKVTYLTVRGNRGISHGDVIDLNRENIDEFDVREFYVQLVKQLKEMGY